MPSRHDLEPVALTETERLAERRYEAYYVFETMAAPHTATLRPGIVGPGEPGHRVFESNYVMQCTCGERGNYATTSQATAERWMAEHLARHERRNERP